MVDIWCTISMIIHNITSSVEVELEVEMFGHSTKWTNQSKFNKATKIVKPTNKKH